MASGFVLSPRDVGLPKKFWAGWRPTQVDALNNAVNDLQEFRFIPTCMPVGSGKSPWYIGLALLMGWRLLVLTMRKGLQDQLMDDFEETGLVSIKGRSNYDCRLAAGLNCEDGLHAKCPYAHDSRCQYTSMKEQALDSQLVTTNYHYWPLINQYGEGLGDFDAVVLDEAAEAPMTVCSVMQVKLTARDIFQLLNRDWPANADKCSMEVWKMWAQHMLSIAEEKYEEIKRFIAATPTANEHLIKTASRWSGLVRRLKILATSKGPWGVEKLRGEGTEGYVLEPLWPDEYAEQVLFNGIPYVIPVSATMRRLTMDLLGIPESQYKFRDYPYTFPLNRAPIYYKPIAQMGQNAEPHEVISMYHTMAQFISARLDRKGVIHCPSYDLRDEIMDSLPMFRNIFITHDRNSVSTDRAVQELKTSPPPRVLISPTIHTGYDLKYSIAEYAIIPKLPFAPIKGSNLMRLRTVKKLGGNPIFGDYLMTQTLQQACGRIVRAEDDQGETIIFDRNMDWAFPACKEQWTSTFRSLWKPWRRDSLPVPPPRLEKR